MGLGYRQRFDGMVLYEIRVIERNYTETDSNVVLTEIL